MYTCSLDAEGAFNAIPQRILFYKLAAVLPKHCWHVMHTWYSNLTVQVKWCGTLNSTIKVSVACVGTRQGHLYSSFLFNLFYQNLISLLSNWSDGITIQNNSKARTFYMGMMRLYNQGNIDQYLASLLSRCKRIIM